MKKKIVILALLAIIYISVKPAHAAGTASGIPIISTATATYDVGPTIGLTATASSSIIVDNKVNVTVTKNADVTVTPGATDQRLVFLLTNTGNTTQRYALSVANGAGIVMNNVRIYRDNGVNPNTWDLSDTLYVNAGTFGDVAADGTLNLLIVADTPGTASDGQTSDYSLVATTVDAGTTTVTAPTVGANTAGVDVVFADIAGSASGDGTRDGKHSSSGKYTVSSVSVTIAKAVIVYSDPFNGTVNPKAKQGAILRYSITVTATGSQTALNVVITDPIPTNTTYSAGTLKLNGVALTDAADADVGQVVGVPVTLTVNLGNLTSASAVQTITFDVTII